MLSDFLANPTIISNVSQCFYSIVELSHLPSFVSLFMFQVSFTCVFNMVEKHSDSVRIANYIKLNTDLFMKFYDRILHEAHVEN